MKYRALRPWLVLVGALLILAALAMAQPQRSVSIPFGETKDLSLELNSGDTALLTVSVTDIPESNVSQLYVQYDSATRDRVFCAPSPKTVNNDTEDFTCVVTSGDALDGYITFVALDANKNVYSQSTKLHLVVTYAEQWFSAKTLARIGSTISVGGQSITVKSASFLYVTLLVNNSPVTAFVNDETKLTDDLYVVYKGYDPDSREVFLEFRSHQPISASVQQVNYYLAAPRYVYPSDDNHIVFDVTTNCSSVKYRFTTTSDWQTMSVSDNRAHFDLDQNVSRIYLQCADDDSVKSVVYIKHPPVIKITPDENTFRSWCTSHNYITKDQCPKPDCSSYCAANGWVKPPAGYTCNFVKPGENNSDYSRIFWGILILALIVGIWYLSKTGRIKLPKRPSAKDKLEQPKPVEEAHDIQ